MRELRTLLPYFRPYRRGLILGLILVVVGNLFTIAGPYVLKLAIDALEHDLRPDLIVRYAGLIVLVAALAGAARFGMREFLNGISRRMETDLRNDLFDHFLRLPAEFYDEWRTGDLMSRVTNDVLAVRQVAGPAIMYLVNTTTISILALSLMVWIDVPLTLLSMAPMLMVPPVVFLFGQRIHDRFEAIQAQFGELSNFVQENLTGVRIVKAYTREEAQKRRFARLNAEYMSHNMGLARIWGAFHPSLMLLTGLGAVVVLWFGGRQVIAGSMTLGDFVAFAFYLTLLTWPMIALGWVTNLFQRGAASMGRINELMRIRPAIADPEDPKRLTHPRGEIEFEDVSFRYPGSEHWALRHVSFRIEPGQTLAVVGSTASGKTTLVRLISRLYEATQGSVRLDGIDVRRLRLSDLRAAMAVVPQEPFLFSMRLRHNIQLQRSETESKTMDLDRALDVAQLRPTLDVLPNRFDTRIGERGVTLSGGQKQRATLARALIRNAPILILDDALSAVDMETETAILDGLRRYAAERTAIIISHRVSAVRNADMILVLEDGRIVERGRHAELVARRGAYATLLERQLLAREIESDRVAAARTE
ncbi:MAG: ABC transporter ATP-binding protein [Gemmatimonadota bacterium]